MKYVFKGLLLFLLSSNAFALWARDIILIQHIENNPKAQEVRSLLLNDFNIPDALISIDEVSKECRQRQSAVIQFCIDREGEVYVVKKNQEVINNALKPLIKDKSLEKINSDETLTAQKAESGPEKGDQ